MTYVGRSLGALLIVTAASGVCLAESIHPGDSITPENASLVGDFVSPGNLALVKQGMQLKIVPTERLEWPPPYKAATEKYSPQVQLNSAGELKNYTAGLPFPSIDPNDPQAALKVMWNFSFRPAYTDDVDIRDVELASYKAGGKADSPVAVYVMGHVGFYNNVGRTEVKPTPTDPDANTGIRYKFGVGPVVHADTAFGWGMIRFRYMDPDIEDNAWLNGKRVQASTLSDIFGSAGQGGGSMGTFARTLDADSFFGFAAKIEDFNYRLLGIKPMLASVHAESLPASRCAADGGRTICPENWEMRQLYVVEADAKPPSWHQRIGGHTLVIPKRIIYVDSEAWLIAASDQYDREGQLWKTIATFNSYRDHSSPDTTAPAWPFKRTFQIALVDEDLQSGLSTVLYSPGFDTPRRESWFINSGVIDENYFRPSRFRTHRQYYER